jgi:hypothetical protein
MSANIQPKSVGQVRCIFGLARKHGLDNDLLHDVVLSVTSADGRQGKKSIAALTFDEADLVIAHLKGSEYKSTPRRTVHYRRKKAGVSQVAQPAHLALMRDLARQRNMSDEGLSDLAKRIIKHYPPRTTSETNKVIEALKSMNRRDAA